MKKIVAIMFIFSFIYGDVMYEMETRTSGKLSAVEQITTTRNFIKGDRMRTEIKSCSPGMDNLTFVSITRFDKGIVWFLNTDKKEYMEIRLVDEGSVQVSGDTINTIPELKIEKSGESKEILNIKCEKYFLSIDINSGNEKTKITQTMWIGNNFPGYTEIKRFNKRILESNYGTDNSGATNQLIEKLRRKISEIDGFPLELEIILKIKSENEEVEMKTSSIIKKISTVPISDRVFEIPDGYKVIPALNSD